MVLTGDVHAAYALDGAPRPVGEPAAVELTDRVDQQRRRSAEPVLPAGQAFLDANPHVHHVDQRRGYLRCHADAGQLTAEVRTVEVVERPGGSSVTTSHSFTVGPRSGR